jgi:hypothetical protein
MVFLDDLLMLLVQTLITSIAVTLPAAVSGYFLLRSHHARVAAELKIRAGTEQFERKVKAYDAIWPRVYEALDYSQGLLDETNWRMARAAQTSYLLAGSLEVVTDYNRVMELIGQQQQPATQSELNRVDRELTTFAKKLWNDMRRDLYGAEALPDNAIKFLGPGEPTRRALGVWLPNRERMGIFTLQGLSDMDTAQVAQRTGMRRESLEELREMAKRELRYWREVDSRRRQTPD